MFCPSDWQYNHFASTWQNNVLSLHCIGLVYEEAFSKVVDVEIGVWLSFAVTKAGNLSSLIPLAIFDYFLCFLETAEMEMKRKSPTCDCGSGSAPAWRRRSTISLKPETCDKFPQASCPKHYIWIDTSHAYGTTTLKFRFLMGIFKFSDPPYGGSNIIFHQIQNLP